MFYEVDVPGKYSVDSKGNTIQSAKPSAAEQIKKTVSNVLNQGKEVVSNLFSFGDEDENAPQREDYPNTRSGAKKFSDDRKLYNAAKSLSQFDFGDDTTGIDSTEYGMNPARYWETEARPIKQSKAVKKIKSMAKTKRQSLSLDEPFVRSKGKKKEGFTR